MWESGLQLRSRCRELTDEHVLCRMYSGMTGHQLIEITFHSRCLEQFACGCIQQELVCTLCSNFEEAACTTSTSQLVGDIAGTRRAAIESSKSCGCNDGSETADRRVLAGASITMQRRTARSARGMHQHSPPRFCRSIGWEQVLRCRKLVRRARQPMCAGLIEDVDSCGPGTETDGDDVCIRERLRSS